MSGFAIALTVFLVILALVALGALYWWLRTQSGAAIRTFYNAVRKMEHDQGTQDRYQTPWLMLVGDPREGALLAPDWQLAPVGRPAWFGRWWADPDGSLLVVPQSLFLPEEGGTAPAFVWRRLLGMLLRLRGQRPLDGVIWVVPLSRLMNEAQLASDAITARRRFSELMQRLGLSLPVQVMVTCMEDMPGFLELLDALPDEARERLLGWSSPYSLDAGWQGYWLDDGLDQVMQALQATVMEVGALRGELGEDLYRLPGQLDSLRTHLRALLEPVFQGNTQGEAPRLRGIYFSGERALGGPADPWAVGTGEGQPQQPAFAAGLWRQRFLAEQGLAQAVPRILYLRQRWQRVTAVVAGVVGVCWLLGMVWVWHDERQDAQVLTRLVKQVQSTHMPAKDAVRRKDVARRKLQDFWTLLRDAPRWHFSALVYPSSWLSDQNARMDEILRTVARSEAIAPILQLEQAELKRLLAIQPERRVRVEGMVPEDWPNYVKARELAYGAATLERQNRWLADALSGDKGVLEPLSQIGNDTLGMELNTGSLHRRAYYDNVLRGLGGSGFEALDLRASRKEASENFRALMLRWQEQYFLADNFVAPAAYLSQHLKSFRLGQGSSLADLESIRARVARLQDILAMTNTTWSHANGEELVAGYGDLMETVRQSTMLGPRVEQGVKAEGEKLRSRFHEQWVAGARDEDRTLLQRQAGNTLALQDHVVALDRAIDDLLRRDFTVAALRKDSGDANPRSLRNVDARALTQAFSYVESYRAFVASAMAPIPSDYREGMRNAAGEAVARAVWASLVASPERAPGATGRVFDVPVDQAMQVLQALLEVGRHDLAGSLRGQLTRMAMADVNGALASIDGMPLFTQRYDIAQWDGSRELGLRLFRASDVQDLKTSLAQQFGAIQGSCEGAAPALAWLQEQPELSVAEQDRVHRLAALSEEMVKYKAQNPTSSPALFEQLVARDFVEMDRGSCQQVLTTATLSTGAGDLARRSQVLRDQAAQRCSDLQRQQAAQAWDALAVYFNQYLAGRFPFAYSLRTEDADPARVQHLVELIDTHLAAAREGLKWGQAADRPAAEDFLTRLEQARAWLGPLLQRDKSGALGLDMEVRWRTDRESERGADQVIAWSLHAADRQLDYPGEPGRLLWNAGEPLHLLLRWAKDSGQRPGIDPLQPSMAVNDLEVGWEYRGPWALMRLLRTHVVAQRQPSPDYTDFPLTLRVPVRGVTQGEPEALMFLRLSLMAQGGKQPLSLQPLPVRAPRSPFDGWRPDSFVSSQVTP
ncbi:type VI secretion system protein [Metapseudomonas otitidis]|uniref:type VI secretion system protein n=1 Tax=Metapseudomonas otitidis TaxID=319939 RepID=UPI001CA44E23|nr:type VI secretion protein IcmF/TssM N-terminal domain-containing protein [Pseudomonas otitidis]QZX85507.1 type VI secretion system protein ImpL [Pseudomonas otitidis]